VKIHSRRNKILTKNKFLIFILLFNIPIFSGIQPPILIGPEDIFQSPNSSYIPTKTDNKSKTPTRWGGASLTQMEKSFNGFPMTVFILGGGAWIYHNKIKLSSSEIEIVGEDAIRADLKGRVQVEDKENNSYFYANKGNYDKVTEKILLEGRPRLFYTAKDKQKTKISADRITRYLNEGKTVLEGKVYIQNAELTVIGEDATYNDNTKKLEISNRPSIFSKNRILSAEKLIYDTESGEVSLENNSYMIQISEESENSNNLISSKKDNNQKSKEDKTKSESIIKQESIFLADKMIHQNSKEPKSTGLYGNAKIYRKDLEFSAEILKSLGSNGDIIQAEKNILNHVILSGDFLEHFKLKEYSYIKGNPSIELLDKENKEVQSTITAVVIERFIDRKEIVTRGNVKIVSQTSTARGEYATYFENEEKIVLEGNPSLERDKKILHSGKIIIYPQEDRVLLSEGMNLKGAE
jgi:lipopolysaccharide export system protein LptA